MACWPSKGTSAPTAWAGSPTTGRAAPSSTGGPAAILLAVCDGGSGRPRTEQHCDAYRGDATLTLHPAHPGQDVEEQVHYLFDGRIACVDADALNLNFWRLRENRKKIQDTVTALCSGRDATGVRKLLTMWAGRDEQGRRRAYAGVAVELLRRRLDHLEKKSKRTRGNRDR